MKKNITRVDALNLAITALSDNADAVEVLTSIRDTIAKANSRKSDKPTKNQLANAALADVIADVLANAAQPLTVTEIMKADPQLTALSNQKVSAVIRGMGDRVERVPDKRVTRFKLA